MEKVMLNAKTLGYYFFAVTFITPVAIFASFFVMGLTHMNPYIVLVLIIGVFAALAILITRLLLENGIISEQ
jgi:hypothetical protein